MNELCHLKTHCSTRETAVCLEAIARHQLESFQ